MAFRHRSALIQVNAGAAPITLNCPCGAADSRVRCRTQAKLPEDGLDAP
jgi:hypothetical protein